MRRILFFLTLFFPVFVSAQLQDDFTDGDFTSNPVWSGDASSFQVLAGQLNSNNQVANSTFYLSTPSTLATSAQWEMYIKLNFSTSSQNYVDVYLVSDAADLNAVTAGYFVRIGNTADEICLYRNDAGTITKIIDGADGRSQPASSNNEFNLKVTRDASNLWTLTDDNTGTGTSFVTEGVVNDATYTSGNFFGIFVKQSTSSFFGKHFFDDIIVSTIGVDNIPPTIISSTAISSTQLDVLFSEPVEQVTAETASNYTVDQGIGVPSSAVRDGSNLSLVHLQFANAFASATTYTVTINNVNDAAGNTILANSTSTFSFAPDVTPPTIVSAIAISNTALDVLFSEDVDLSTAQSVSNYTVDNAIGAPNSAQRDGSDFKLVHLTFTTVFSTATTYTLTINNVADLALNSIAANSTITFTYSTISSPMPGDVVITEIMPDPDPAIGLPNAEFVEIYNRSNKTFDLNGWKFSDSGSPHDLTPFQLKPDSFLILCSTTSATSFAPFGSVMGVTSFPSLNNTGGDDVIIYDVNSIVIDKVHYDETYYRDPSKVNGGWSIERIDPDFTCTSKENWKASVDPSGGTPGRVNSVDGTYSDNIAPRLLRACLQDSMHVELFFSEPIPDSALSNAANYLISETDVLVGNPAAAVSYTDGMSVVLTLTTSANTGIWSVTVIPSVTDCAGNAITSATANFATPVASSPGDILINEVLFSVNNGATDFVELYNASQKIIDLGTLQFNNYSITYGIPNAPQTLSAGCYLMFPSTYVVLSDAGDKIKAHYFTPNPDAFLDMAFPDLLTDEDIIVLRNSSSEVIDSLHYYSSWHFPLLNDVHNVSLERLSTAGETNSPLNWHSAAETVGFATPGYKNSQQNEGGSGNGDITIEPEVFSPDNDGIKDVVNILFHFDTPGYLANVKVYDSKGRPVRTLIENQLLGNEGLFSWDGVNDDKEKSRTGIYVFYIEVFNLNGDVKEYKKTCVLATKL